MAYGTITPVLQNISTGDNNIDGLLTGLRWASSNVTFSFTSSFYNDYEEEINYPNKYASGFQSLNSTQRTAARQWMQMYEDVSGLNLLEMILFSAIVLIIALKQVVVMIQYKAWVALTF